MIGKIKFALILFSLLSLASFAQEGGYPDRVRNYVQQYAGFAISDQRSTGVPAAITLGQGILETEAGLSELMVKANNHFGIKCKNGWQGETFLHTDDAKNECFKKYASAQESYHDHSAHLLKNQRYSILFTYSPTDYARWAHGLKKCGYATNPQYAYMLIKIIEEYKLQEYSYAALDSTYKIKGIQPLPYEQQLAATVRKRDSAIQCPVVKTDTTIIQTVTTQTIVTTPAVTANPSADSVAAIVTSDDTTSIAVSQDTSAVNEENKILTVNGLKAVYAHKGDALLSYAVKYKIRYGHLLEINDLPDEPLQFDSYLYLEKKNNTGPKSKHLVKEGETLLMIAQEEGMQLKKLAAFNLLSVNEQPVAGTALYLQETAPVKPNIKDAVFVYDGGAATNSPQETEPQASVIAPKATEEVSFGMGFEAPKEATAPVKKADTVKVQAPTEIVKQPFMRDDPPQPQLKKPATEIEYKKGDKKYIVKRGETAFSIAKKHNITVAELLKWNDIEAQDLKAGQTIIVKK